MTSMKALRMAIQEQGRFTPSALPAPVLGWNARDALDGMAPGYAVRLDNFFPYNGFVTLRGGSQQWAADFGGSVDTLAYFNTFSVQRVIAGANGQLWEVSDGAKVSLKSGFTGNQWQWDMTKGSRNPTTGATPYLYLLNGADTPQAYDGTTMADVTWAAKSGQATLDITQLNNIMIAKDVLFLTENNQLGFWHGDKGAVAPNIELSWFDLGTILPGGGSLVAMATMTVEGGVGPDDYSVFIADTGQVVLYSGNDPNQATDWALIGVYPLGRALGKRCTLELAGDVVILTVNGYISMRQFMATGGLERQSFAFNDNIQPEVVRQTQANGAQFGWQPVLLPGLTLALFNVPTGMSTSVQHVVNTQTAAWSQVKGWNGRCWLNAGGTPLFGTSDGTVVEANVGGVDVGNKAVIGQGLTAFDNFGPRGRRKKFTLVRPILETIGNVNVRVAMAVDYDPNVQLIPTSVPGGDVASEWDVGEWDSAIWGGAPITRTEWQSVSAFGYAAAFFLDVTSTGTRCRWKSADFAHTTGGLI